MPLLFSYGTLQQEAVQRSTFGRPVHGVPDSLVGFERRELEVDDPAFAAWSGRAKHSIVHFTGQSADRVNGTVLELTDAELASADAYEPAEYTRISTILSSGKQAWVYADASS